MESIYSDFTLNTTTSEEATLLLNTDTKQGLTIEKAKESLDVLDYSVLPTGVLVL